MIIVTLHWGIKSQCCNDFKHLRYFVIIGQASSSTVMSSTAISPSFPSKVMPSRINYREKEKMNIYIGLGEHAISTGVSMIALLPWKGVRLEGWSVQTSIDLLCFLTDSKTAFLCHHLQCKHLVALYVYQTCDTKTEGRMFYLFPSIHSSVARDLHFDA